MTCYALNPFYHRFDICWIVLHFYYARLLYTPFNELSNKLGTKFS